MNVVFLVAVVFAFAAFTSGFVSSLVVGGYNYLTSFIVGLSAAALTLGSFLLAWLVAA